MVALGDRLWVKAVGVARRERSQVLAGGARGSLRGALPQVMIGKEKR
jgi:hypothetical protein